MDYLALGLGIALLLWTSYLIVWSIEVWTKHNSQH